MSSATIPCVMQGLRGSFIRDVLGHHMLLNDKTLRGTAVSGKPELLCKIQQITDLSNIEEFQAASRVVVSP